MRKIDIFDENHTNGTFCLEKCPIDLTENITCNDICINAMDYCNGVIDLKTQFEFDQQNEFIFVSNSSNYTTSDALLYPDELYCSYRLHATFMICYVLSFVSFSFGIAIVMRTRPLIHFLLRRRAKELKKMEERGH